MSRQVRKEPCPRCRARGADRKGDNLAVYDDGHKWCFSCNLFIPAYPWTIIEGEARQRSMMLQDPKANGQTIFTKPDGSKVDVLADSVFPIDFTPMKGALWAKDGLSWLRSYGITNDEIDKYDIGWSMRRQMVVFPVREDDNILYWQGRCFGADIQKYKTYGERSKHLHLIGNIKSDTLVVVEDYVSAIKVGRQFRAAPLFGSSMSLEQIRKASDRFSSLGVWLDKDKARESALIALRASQYIPVFIVSSTLDPKKYGDEFIKEHIESNSYETLYKDQLDKKPTVVESSEEEEKRLARDRIRAAAGVHVPNPNTVYACGTCTLAGTRDQLSAYGKVCEKDVCVQRSYSDVPNKRDWNYRKDNGGS